MSTDRLRNDLWASLGFMQNPYDFRPLRSTPEDAELLVGRDRESIVFSTILDSGLQGVCVLSGRPGVGKTSFFNVQQYRSATGIGQFGPRLLTAEQPCTIRPGDSVRDISRRVLEVLVKSLEIECYARGTSIPKESAKVAKWVKQTSAAGSIELGLTILGFGGNFGRSSTLPGFEEASYESICDAISAVVAEVVVEMDFDGIFMPLDNLENLDDQQLSDLLISFRDTLFEVPRVWWVLIGQSGLGSLIQTLDPRVWERISGSGLELEPLPIGEVHQAIERRVSRFSLEQSAVSPLPISIHEKIYSASQGELRYTLKKSTDICIEFVSDIRQQILAANPYGPSDQLDTISDALARHFVNKQVPETMAEKALRRIVKREVDQLGLSVRERRTLAKIAHLGEVRPRDYDKISYKSMQNFQTLFLTKFHSQHLLFRRQEGKPVYYGLRGIALLACQYGLLEDDVSENRLASEEDSDAGE
jgi:hypothetical protein